MMDPKRTHSDKVLKLTAMRGDTIFLKFSRVFFFYIVHNTFIYLFFCAPLFIKMHFFLSRTTFSVSVSKLCFLFAINILFWDIEGSVLKYYIIVKMRVRRNYWWHVLAFFLMKLVNIRFRHLPHPNTFCTVPELKQQQAIMNKEVIAHCCL